LSVADNAGDAVFLHVFASSERQEWGNKTGLKKRTKREILKHHDVYVSFNIVVLFHGGSWYTFTFTSYFVSDYHIKTKTKHTP
jgi:predicted MFS family arabinose efflux permease